MKDCYFLILKAFCPITLFQLTDLETVSFLFYHVQSRAVRTGSVRVRFGSISKRPGSNSSDSIVPKTRSKAAPLFVQSDFIGMTNLPLLRVFFFKYSAKLCHSVPYKAYRFPKMMRLSFYPHTSPNAKRARTPLDLEELD